MDFNSPAERNLFDTPRVIGTRVTRVDGPLKVSGQAPYAYERHDVTGEQLVGYPVVAGIAQGRVLSIDTAAAEASPGVVTVVTTLETGDMPQPSSMNVAPLFGGDRIHHYHQAVAVVVAETFEQARAAAALVRVETQAADGDYDLEAAWQRVREDRSEPVSRVGDFETAFAAAPVQLDGEYRTPGQSHAMMEPHATLAEWQDGKLTVWTSNQMVGWAHGALAKTLGMAKEDVRIESPFIGGGFGGKLFLRADAILAALAARKAGHPVKVALPRPMIINNTTHRAATIQRIRIGAGRDGRITAIAHEAISHTLPGGSGEDAVDQTRYFYAGENRLIVKHLAEMQLPESNAMRAPGEASGLMALEIAMDEMAEKLGMDPVEFRAVNDIQVAPENPEQPFSDRNFVACLQRGAKEFGWDDRPVEPGTRREGAWLVGYGMAGAYRGAPAQQSGARVRLLPTGRLVVETDMTDIGTGSYTILAQTAAEVMGLPVDMVDVHLGNSAFPKAAGSGGQWGAASSTAGTYAACVALQARIAQKLGHNDPTTLTFADGSVSVGSESHSLTDIAAGEEIVAEDSMSFGDFRDNDYLVSTFGAHYVELAVHAATGEVRLRRMLSVCDSGRILNPITARSQVIGGMVMGIGAALMEDLPVDRDHGFFPAHDLAGYEVPIHLDVPSQEVIFLDTVDGVSGPLKAKGVAELGICGVAAAVANAIHNATGVRVREYPIRLDRYLDRLPAL